MPCRGDLVYPSRIPPFTVEHVFHYKSGGGGGVGIFNNIFNKEWVDMCGAAYTLAAVTNRP